MVFIKRWLDYYSDLFSIDDKQEEFILNYAKNCSSPTKLLNVECGSALFTDRLSKKLDVTVTDTYPEFINAINARHFNQDNTIHAFNLQPIDIARYLGKNFFDIICCFNNRIILMKDRTLIKKFIFDSKVLLKDNGYLILEIVNFSKYDFTNQVLQMPVIESKRGSLYSTIVKDSDEAKYKLFEHIVSSSGKVIDLVKDEEICPLSIETLKQISTEIKFSSVEFFGDYDLSQFTPDSKRLICIFKK